jgi:ankyrin repeat protein
MNRAVKNRGFSALQPIFVGAVGFALTAVGLAWQHDLRVRRSSLRAALITAVEAGNLSGVRAILDRGADPNSREKPMPRPAGVVQSIARPFCPLKANAVDEGGTALTLAARRGDWRAMMSLLDHGADINARDYCGFTALEWAVNSNAPSRLEAVRLLVSRHATVNTLDNCGMSPIAYAREWVHVRIPPEPDNVEMVKLLERAGAR